MLDIINHINLYVFYYLLGKRYTSHAQSGILVAHSKFGLFIEAMVVGN